MKEALKQAIEEAIQVKDYPVSGTDLKIAASIVLSTPSILLHADPEIMKQAGWESSEWISVKDRLPEEKGFYLTVIDSIVVASWRPNIEINELFDSISNRIEMKATLRFHDYVTHWKPLPQPPKQ